MEPYCFNGGDAMTKADKLLFQRTRKYIYARPLLRELGEREAVKGEQRGNGVLVGQNF